MELYDEIDIGFDYEYDNQADIGQTDGEKMSIADACIKCKDKFGIADIEWIAEASGVSPQQVVVSPVHGTVLYQDPESFKNDDKYQLTKGWKYSGQFKSGNITQKLQIAERMAKKFPGCFTQEVEALRELIPNRVPFSNINIQLGASWVPTEVYEDFLHHFFKVKASIEVIYIEELAKFKIEADEDVKLSTVNISTFGTHKMPALKIIENTMNVKPNIPVYDYTYNYSYLGSSVDSRTVNKIETSLAEKHEAKIIQSWEAYLNGVTPYKLLLEDCYNDKLVGYHYCQFDGSFLSLPDLNPEINLYKNQRDAVAHAILSPNNLLVAHDVGTGKTYTSIVFAHEYKRMGLGNKIMMVFSNVKVDEAADDHKLLYPNDKILKVTPKSFKPDRRNDVLKEIRDGDYVAVYIAYSCFNMIKMSTSHWINKKLSQIKKFKRAKASTSNKVERRMLEKKINSLNKSLQKYMETAEDTEWLCFDDLCIDTLVVDEAQNYKNASIESSVSSIVGMHKKGSTKCDEMMEKCSVVNKLIFTSATPIPNSLADVNTMQRYLQPNELEYNGLDSFDTWVNTFAERETNLEVDVDGSSLRPMTRFCTFHNLTELMSLFSSVCDFYTNDDRSGLPQWDGYIDIQYELTPEQRNYLKKDLTERLKEFRAGNVDRTVDNLLKIYTDGIKASIDLQCCDPNATPSKYFPNSKLNVCSDKVKEMYDKYPGTAQVIFCDIGTPKDGFNVYDSLREALEKRGIPSNEIAYIHDATTESKRKALFKDLNKGKIRVIIGSTMKLGEGTNFQEKLIALHHYSVPWRPSDMTQRNGRILRNYNTCEKVYIYRYFAQGSFDSYSWQILENKQKFISSFMSGKSTVRDADDISDTTLTYGEIKALCIGNPLIKNRVEISNEITRVKTLSAQKQSQLYDVRAIIDSYNDKKNALFKQRLTIKRDMKLYEESKEKISNDERKSFGEELLIALSENNLNDTESVFDTYQGFDIVLPANMLIEKPYIYIKSKNGGLYHNDMSEVKTALGCSKSIDHLLDHLGDKYNKLGKDAYNLKQNYETAKADYEAGNPHEAELADLKRKLNIIDEEIKKKDEEEKKDVA